MVSPRITVGVETLTNWGKSADYLVIRLDGDIIAQTRNLSRVKGTWVKAVLKNRWLCRKNAAENYERIARSRRNEEALYKQLLKEMM